MIRSVDLESINFYFMYNLVRFHWNYVSTIFDVVFVLFVVKILELYTALLFCFYSMFLLPDSFFLFW